MKKRVCFILLLSMIGAYTIPIFSLAETKEGLSGPKVPDTLEQAKEETGKVGSKIASGLPGVIKKIWEDEVFPVWKDMLNWVNETVWEKYLSPPFQNVWEDIEGFLGKEIERKKPILQQEFEREKEELKKELQTQTSKASQSLWGRFKSLFNEH